MKGTIVNKKAAWIGGPALAVALMLAGGATLTAGAAAPISTPTVAVTETATTSTPQDAETADDNETADETGADTDNVQEGPGNESETEDTSDDVNGVDVEDGTAD